MPATYVIPQLLYIFRLSFSDVEKWISRSCPRRMHVPPSHPRSFDAPGLPGGRKNFSRLHTPASGSCAADRFGRERRAFKVVLNFYISHRHVFGALPVYDVNFLTHAPALFFVFRPPPRSFFALFPVVRFRRL